MKSGISTDRSLGGRVTLDQLQPGERARVKACLGEGPVFQRLCEMGLVEGVHLRLVRFAPFGDPLQLELDNYQLSLRKSEAAMIRVERLNGKDHTGSIT